MEKLMEQLDGPIDLTTALPKKNRRSSFFDLPPVEEPKQEVLKANQIIDKLKKEWKDWQDVFQAQVKMDRRDKPKKYVLDLTYLTDEHKDYLSKAIDVENYVEGLHKFSDEVLIYSKKKEWLQMRIDCCNRNIDETVKEKVLGKVQL